MSTIMDIRCDNMTLVGNLCSSLDLEHLVRCFPAFDFSKKLPALVAHFDDPRITMLIWSTGRVTVMGIKCLYSAYYAMRKLCALLRPHYPEVRLTPLQLQNVMCSAKLGWCIDLARCARENPTICEYNPEFIDHMRVRTDVEKIRHLLYDEGQLQCNGGKSMLSTQRSILSRLPLYLKYKCEVPPVKQKRVGVKRRRTLLQDEEVLKWLNP